MVTCRDQKQAKHFKSEEVNVKFVTCIPSKLDKDFSSLKQMPGCNKIKRGAETSRGEYAALYP